MSAPRTRLFWGLVWATIAAVLLLCGWLMPVYLRAVDVAVLQNAGRNLTAPPSLVPAGEPVARFLIRPENREKALASLSGSPVSAVQELLRCRQLTNTILFPPSSSASGQAFDTAVALCGLLMTEGTMTPELRDEILARAASANHGGDPQPLEEILMDEMSLGQRWQWPRVMIFNAHINDAKTLAILSDAVRNAGEQLLVIFSAVELSQKPAAVARYLSAYPQTSLHDLAGAENFGSGGVNELLERQQRLYISPIRQHLSEFIPFSSFSRVASHSAWRSPRLALMLKWLFYLTGGFFIAAAIKVAKVGPGHIGGGLLAGEVLFASGVLFVALLVSEPFLAQESAREAMPFRLHLPAVGGTIASQITHAKSIMNIPNLTTSLLTLLLFFVLQALIFMACLSRLKETLRQNAPARVKLKLLENEEHLFDAGLYLGFVGTIICLILVSLNILQFSLMAAYSSTSFGIIFVSILKIFKVRPARRILLLQAEEESAGVEAAAAPLSATTLVTAP